MNCVVFCCGGGDPTKHNVDSNVYKPGKHLYGYIHWTFTASFTSVFLSFLLIFSAFNVAFGGLLMLAGNREPNCIMMAGEPFGTTPNTKFSDAFALSWTTFTTVVSKDCFYLLLKECLHERERGVCMGGYINHQVHTQTNRLTFSLSLHRVMA